MDNEGLALVCASIGGLEEDDHGKEIYVKSADCLENLKDLQRYLRRDHPETREVFFQLGKWNTVRQDLVPIIRRYSDDYDLVLNCVKILVFLTMPLGPSPHQAAVQIEYLQNFKAAILEGDCIAVIVSHLEEPLLHLESGSPREDDWKMFQLFLTLLRNFLSIPDYLPQHSSALPQLSSLRDDMLQRLFGESVMELVVALTQHVAGRGGLRQDNLLILEIIYHIFSGHQADVVAAAADKGAKLANQSEKSAATIQTFMRAEKEQLKRLRDGNSPFSGTFVKVARDGSKTILTSNPHQSLLERFARKPHVKRGHVKHLAQEAVPIVRSPDHIYVLLKDFANQFLASGYNILMQSIKEDIRRERTGFETPDIVTFFRVAQFFTSYQCCTAQKNQKIHGKSDGADDEAEAQKHLCGLISSTMDEDMFTMVISKWHEYADSAVASKDWGPLAAAGGVVKDMIRMLDLVLRRSGTLTKEGQQEVRTARILLYKAFYDQTDSGVIHFLRCLFKSFDIYKQPRSHLADLVEITHTVLRILDSFVETGESLRVLKKVHKGKKKRDPASMPSEQPQNQEGEQNATEVQGSEKASDEHASGSPEPAGVEMQNLDPELSDDGEMTQNTPGTSGNTLPQDNSAVNLEDKATTSSFESDEEAEGTFDESPPGDSDAEGSDGGEPKRTKEVSLDMRRALGEFADNEVVRNYCWLLKFYSANRATTNYYIVRMLQRICEDCLLEPMLYQISILQIFYSILSDEQVQAAGDHRFVVAFLSKLVHRLFKKLKAHPILFVELLFWKTRKDCHNISADYMIHSLRRATGGSTRGGQRINIADALGDDEDETVPSMGPESDSEGGSPRWQQRPNIADALGDDEDETAPSIQKRPAGMSGDAESFSDDETQNPAMVEENNVFSDSQEARIRELFERYKHDDDKGRLIALELDSSGMYTGAQVMCKLRQLHLVQHTSNRSSGTGSGGHDAAVGANVASQSRTKTLKKKSSHPTGDDMRTKRSKIFSEAHDEELRRLFSRHEGDKNLSKVIAENMGGVFKTDQVSRRLRALGLVKPKQRTALSSLHANLTDSEDDNPIICLSRPAPGQGQKVVKEGRDEVDSRLAKGKLRKKTPNLKATKGKEDKIVYVSSKRSKLATDAHDSDDEVLLSSAFARSTKDAQDSDDDMPLSTVLARGETSTQASDDDLPLTLAVSRNDVPSNKSQTDATLAKGLRLAGDIVKRSKWTRSSRDLNHEGGHDDRGILGEEGAINAHSPLRQQTDHADVGREISNARQNLHNPEVSTSGLQASWGLGARKRVQALDMHDEEGNLRAADTKGLHAVFGLAARLKTKGRHSEDESSSAASPATVPEIGPDGNHSKTTEKPHFKPSSDFESEEEDFLETVQKRRRLTKPASTETHENEQEDESQVQASLQPTSRRIARKMAKAVVDISPEIEGLNDF